MLGAMYMCYSANPTDVSIAVSVPLRGRAAAAAERRRRSSCHQQTLHVPSYNLWFECVYMGPPAIWDSRPLSWCGLLVGSVDLALVDI